MQSDPYKLIDLAELTDDENVKRKALRAAIGLLAEMDAPSADVSYALGYAWYLMPDETEERRRQVFRHLDAALQKMPEHLYARMYLAHHYFDTSQYAFALPILQGFGPEDFAAKGQEWRDVKVAELILVCLLELHDDIRIPSAVQYLFECVNRADVSDVPMATELATALQRLIHASSMEN
ncbi:MAG: hypothetical protein LBE06_04380 [Azoarcus sp.]|jgi:hypothetical protein|nr:hypothetical protein [Azoarcus sp.]